MKSLALLQGFAVFTLCSHYFYKYITCILSPVLLSASPSSQYIYRSNSLILYWHFCRVLKSLDYLTFVASFV
jgi:hypothetical protein